MTYLVRNWARRIASAGSRRPQALWTVVNERDELGSDLVPDYLTSVREGALPRGPRKTASDARPKIVNARNAQHPDFGRLPKIAADWWQGTRVFAATRSVQRPASQRRAIREAIRLPLFFQPP